MVRSILQPLFWILIRHHRRNDLNVYTLIIGKIAMKITGTASLVLTPVTESNGKYSPRSP